MVTIMRNVIWVNFNRRGRIARTRMLITVVKIEGRTEGRERESERLKEKCKER